MRSPGPSARSKPCAPADSHISPLFHAVRHEHRSNQVDLNPRSPPRTAGKEPWRRLVPRRRPRLDGRPGSTRIRKATNAQAKSWQESRLARPPRLLFPWIGADDAIGTQVRRRHRAADGPLAERDGARDLSLTARRAAFPYSELARSPRRASSRPRARAYRSADLQRPAPLHPARRGWRAGHDVESTTSRRKAAVSRATGLLRALGGPATAGRRPEIRAPQALHRSRADPARLLDRADLRSHTGPAASLLETPCRAASRPRRLNEEFDYNQLGAGTTFARAAASQLAQSLGSKAPARAARSGATSKRSTARSNFHSGLGGGYNQNSFPIAATPTGSSHRSLATRRRAPRPTGPCRSCGHGQALLDPLPRAARLHGVLQLRCGLGRARSRGGAGSNLIRAHGYNVDLQLENKGVRFNARTRSRAGGRKGLGGLYDDGL